MTETRIALVGLGPMGQAMARYIHAAEGATVVAFCDRSPGVLEQAVAAFAADTGKTVPGYTAHTALMKRGGYDAVAIACSPYDQPALAEAEMARGVHVLCQVPVALTMEDCHRLIAAAGRYDVCFVGAEEAREWQFVRAWRRLAAAGKIGHVFFAEGSYLHYEPRWDWLVDKATGQTVTTDDVSLLRDERYTLSWRGRLFAHPIYYLPHTLSPLLAVTGGRITKVACFGTRQGSYAHPGFPARDVETAVMYNDADTVFQVRAGFTSPHGFHRGTGAHWYQIKGSRATLEWSRSELDEPRMFTLQDGWQARPDWTVIDPAWDGAARQSGHGGADMMPVRHFLNAVRRGIRPEMDALACVELAAPAIAAARSSEEGGNLIRLPDFRSEIGT